MAMKDKMEVTMGICIGSSIVSYSPIVYFVHISSYIANRCFCYSTTRDYWLVVSSGVLE